MAVEYRIALRNEGWMIEREGQLYGPYGSKQEALSEAVYVANYSISHGLQAEVIVQKYLGNLDRFIPALRTIIPQPWGIVAVSAVTGAESAGLDGGLPAV